jgi:glycogen operon protein
VFRRTKFLTGHEVRGSGLPDVWWFRIDGRRMTQKDWLRHDLHTLGVFLNGSEIPSRTPDGRDIEGDSFLLLFNASPEAATFILPARRFGKRWQLEIATGEGAPEEVVAPRSLIALQARSLVLFRRV